MGSSKSWRERVSPGALMVMVRVLGGVMLASVLLYFAALTMSFSTFFPRLAGVFLPRIILFVYVPLSSSAVYFYVRVQVGRWLLDRGALEQARNWCEPRLAYSFWLRGRREVLIQRVVLAQVLVRQLDYERCQNVLWPEQEFFPSSAPELVELARWRAEWALRSDNLVKVRQAFEWVEGMGRPRVEKAALLACMAERALREGKRGVCRQMLEEAEWIDPTSRRAFWVHVLFDLDRLEESSEEAKRALLVRVDEVLEWVNVYLPGASVELLVWRAKVLGALGHFDEAEQEIAGAAALVARGRADRRSRLIFQDMIGEDAVSGCGEEE